jgi:uncharacterized tellurite resistance protein B-like protein
LPQRSALAAELRRQLEFQELLKEHVAPALVDGVIALLAIQLRELELQQAPMPPAPSHAPAAAERPASTGETPLVLDASLEMALVHLLMGVVTVDGLTKNVELRRIREYFQGRPDYAPGALSRIDELVHYFQEREPDADVVALGQPFLGKSYDERLAIYSVCVGVAFADDELVDEEVEFLQHLAGVLEITSEDAARVAVARREESVTRLEELERRQRGQFPTQAAVRFQAIQEIVSVGPPETPESTHRNGSEKQVDPPRETIEPVRAGLGTATPLPAAETVLPAAEAYPPPHAEPDFTPSSDALSRTIELMAAYICEKRSIVNPQDREWEKLTKFSPELTIAEIDTVLRQCPVLRATGAGQYELARPLVQKETIEVKIFSVLLGSGKPVSARLLARTQGANPDKAVQIVLKIAQECPAFVCYGYGCGTWFGLALWGRLGYQETVRQNLTPIKKQLQDGGSAALSALELAVVLEVAKVAKDRALLELVS